MRDDFRLAGFSVMALSILFLFDCLLNVWLTDFFANAFRGRDDYHTWRKRVGGELSGANLEDLQGLEESTKDEALGYLLQSERKMVQDNYRYLIKRRRARIHGAVVLYVISLVILFAGLQIGH
ncbi:hypothetical protein BX264_3158 [Streptomyces sp. 2333.5]|nr:hypothetical protein BX264_3158 [Streptomyces sp. 2333.5]SED28025.1 hypothetical protein SAMN05428943_3298 [Streptomyces sp. 2314.4]SEE15596.1 hypothetical protein SAMN05428942_3262 [Streptomyces sp. 2112.2]